MILDTFGWKVSVYDTDHVRGYGCRATAEAGTPTRRISEAGHVPRQVFHVSRESEYE